MSLVHQTSIWLVVDLACSCNRTRVTVCYPSVWSSQFGQSWHLTWGAEAVRRVANASNPCGKSTVEDMCNVMQHRFLACENRVWRYCPSSFYIAFIYVFLYVFTTSLLTFWHSNILAFRFDCTASVLSTHVRIACKKSGEKDAGFIAYKLGEDAIYQLIYTKGEENTKRIKFVKSPLVAAQKHAAGRPVQLELRRFSRQPRDNSRGKSSSPTKDGVRKVSAVEFMNEQSGTASRLSWRRKIHYQWQKQPSTATRKTGLPDPSDPLSLRLGALQALSPNQPSNLPTHSPRRKWKRKWKQMWQTGIRSQPRPGFKRQFAWCQPVPGPSCMLASQHSPRHQRLKPWQLGLVPLLLRNLCWYRQKPCTASCLRSGRHFIVIGLARRRWLRWPYQQSYSQIQTLWSPWPRHLL